MATRKKAKRRKVKRRRKLTAAQIRAGFGGKAAQTRARRRKAAGRKRSAPTRRKTGGSKVARKRRSTKRRSTARRSTKRRRRGGSIRLTPVRGRIYRKNPRFGGRIMKDLVAGAQGAAGVVVGKAAGRVVAGLLPFPKDTPVGAIGSQIVSALVLGMVGKRFLPSTIANYVFVGALTAPVETGLRMIPGVGGLLGEDPFLPMGENPFLPMGAYPSIEAYPEGMEYQSEFGY